MEHDKFLMAIGNWNKNELEIHGSRCNFSLLFLSSSSAYADSVTMLDNYTVPSFYGYVSGCHPVVKVCVCVLYDAICVSVRYIKSGTM